jgi:hypothetical protein
LISHQDDYEPIHDLYKRFQPMKIPAFPLALTLAGVLPFALGVLAAFIGWPVGRLSAHALVLTYGAVILSFLGGVQWGMT